MVVAPFLAIFFLASRRVKTILGELQLLYRFVIRRNRRSPA